MAFPDLTFRDQLPPDVRQELEQLVALLNGYLAAEHDSEGAHTHINAESLTVEGDTIAQGDGIFDGDVAARNADAAGPVRLTSLVESTVDDGIGGPGIEFGTGADRGTIYSVSGGATDYVKFGFGTQTPLQFRRVGAQVCIEPGPVSAVTTSIELGGDLSAQHIFPKARIAEVFHTHSATVAQGKWQAYVPTWTNVTVGDGTVTARYTRVMGKTIKGYVRFVLGSTSAVSGAAVVSVPLTIHASLAATSVRIGDCAYRDNSAGQTFMGAPLVNTNTTIALFDTASPVSNVNTTVPFTWAQDDVLYVSFEFEEA